MWLVFGQRKPVHWESRWWLKTKRVACGTRIHVFIIVNAVGTFFSALKPLCDNFILKTVNPRVFITEMHESCSTS